MTAIRAPEAWDVTTGSPQVPVAVVDTGIDATHPDLAANLWTNPGESGAGRETNGLDDDGNGRIDDVHGWDFVDHDAQPQDGNGHGTHVSGTIAARGNDASGVAGLNWSSAIMPLRVLGDDGSGFVSDAITAYAYAARNGARVVNASLGGAELLARRARRHRRGVRTRSSSSPPATTAPTTTPRPSTRATTTWPTSSASPPATATTRSRPSPTTAPTNVDLAAPGVDIASTWPGGRYALLDGTSMATPHVSGAAALLLAHDGGLTVAGLRAALLSSAHPVAALAGRVATGGRLDVAAALSVAPGAARAAGGPAARGHRPAPRRPARRVGGRSHRAGRLAAHRPRQAAHASAPADCASRSARRRRAARASTSASTRAALGRLHLASRTIGRASARLAAAGRKTVTVRVSARVARALRTAARLRVVAHVVAVDAAGNRRGTQRAATLTR